MSAITTAIQNYRDGKLTWIDLFKYLTTRDYPTPDRYQNLPEDPLAREQALRDRSHYTDGTWDEVIRARNYGLLHPNEFDLINTAMWENHPKPTRA